MSSVNIDFALPTLHPKQEHIIKNAKRFNHLRCGRRFGKTTLIEELSSVSLDGFPVGIWFPTYKDLSEVWKDLKKLYSSIISHKDEQLKQINLVTGGLIDFWSLEDPDSGQGRKYKRAIIDEAAKAAKLYQAWENTIRPTLTDYMGDAWILSRPKGKNNGFFKIEEKHRKFDNWAFFHFTSYDNCKDVGGHLERSEIDEAKTQLDTITFQQEYEAEYVDANDKPYLYAFDEKKHTIEGYTPSEHLPITISFDFNKDPMTCLVSQSPDISTLVIFDEMKINNGSTPELCEMIIGKYPGWLGQIFVTGDATGQNRNAMVRGNTNNYTLIKKILRLKDHHLLVRTQNMAHGNSRILCNSVIQNARFIITDNCKETIMDCSRASVDDEGDLIKTQEEGRHFFDNVRYTIDCKFHDFIEKPKKYRV